MRLETNGDCDTLNVRQATYTFRFFSGNLQELHAGWLSKHINRLRLAKELKEWAEQTKYTR